MKALEWLVVLAPISIFLGSFAFLSIYRPIDPRKHSPAGRHLQFMAAAIMVVFGLESLITILWLADSLPDRGLTGAIIELGAYTFMAGVVWQRVFMVQKHRKSGIDEEKKVDEPPRDPQ